MPNPIADLSPSADVCQILGIDRSTLSRWVAAGKIVPAARFPGRTGAMLFTTADVEALRSDLQKAPAA